MMPATWQAPHEYTFSVASLDSEHAGAVVTRARNVLEAIERVENHLAIIEPEPHSWAITLRSISNET